MCNACCGGSGDKVGMRAADVMVAELEGQG